MLGGHARTRNKTASENVARTRGMYPPFDRATRTPAKEYDQYAAGQRMINLRGKGYEIRSADNTRQKGADSFAGRARGKLRWVKAASAHAHQGRRTTAGTSQTVGWGRVGFL